METKHTPGPWVLKEQGDANEYCILAPDNSRPWVAAFRLNGEQTNGTQLANIKLMAAAPDILEALEGMIEMYEQVQPSGGWQGVYECALIAKNKATE